MKKSYHNKLKTILHLAITDLTKKTSYNATLNFWQNQKHVQYSMFAVWYIYVSSAHLCICKYTYHHHMSLFENTYSCKILTCTSSSMSTYVVLSKKVQYLLVISIAFCVCTHEHIIWETLKNHSTSSKNWNFLHCIDISILSTHNAVLYTYIYSEHSSCLLERYIFSAYLHMSWCIYHDHIDIFHDTYKCNLLIESTNNTSKYIVVFKKLQTYTLWISILWVYMAHEEIISQ